MGGVNKSTHPYPNLCHLHLHIRITIHLHSEPLCHPPTYPPAQEFDAIIDRNRKPGEGYGALKADCAHRTDSFDAEQAMVNLRELNGQV